MAPIHPLVPDGIFELAEIERRTWPEKAAALRASGVPLNDGNEFLTMPTVARRALATLYNQLVFAGLVYRDYDVDFAGKKGDTITVRRPAVFQAKEFNRSTGIEIQDAAETSFAVKLDTLLDVSFAVTAEDLTLKIDDFAERLLRPAMEALVQDVDGRLAAAAIASATGGGEPQSGLTIEADNDTVTLEEHGLMNGDKVTFPTLTGGAGLTAATVQYYVRDRTADTFKVSATPGGAAVNITTDYTAGSVALAGGGTVTPTATKGDATVLVNARTALSAALAPPANRYAVVSPEQAGELLQDPLMVEADKRGDTDGLREAAIGRKFGFDAYESTALSGLNEGVAFHRDSLALVTRTLELPMGATPATAASENYKGLGLRVVKAYDINKKQDVISVDALIGVKSVRPNWSVELDLS